MSERNSTERLIALAVRRAVAYYRMSTLSQEASIPEQRDWCRPASQKENLDLVREFADEGIPGSEIEKRPGLQALLEFCEKQFKLGRPIRVVVCWDADRLSRASSIRTAAVLDRLMAAGVTHLLTSEGWFDLEDDCDVLLHNVKQDMGRAAYSRSIAKNVTRSALDRARQGLWVAGKPPYGYAIGADRKLVPVEPEASAVRKLFARALAGDSLAEMARMMNEQKVTPPGNNRKPRDPEYRSTWRRTTISRILHNPNYAGDLVWNRVRQGKYQRVTGGQLQKVTGQRGAKINRKNAADDVVVTRDAHPAIVSRETFEAVAARQLSGRWQRTAPCNAGEWIFSGLIRCGDCGARMHGRNHRSHSKSGVVYRRYFCSNGATKGEGGTCRMNGANQDLVLAAVLGELREIYSQPDRLQRLADAVAETAAQTGNDAAADLDRIEADLADVAVKIATAEGNMAFAPRHQLHVFSRVLDGLTARREELIAARDALAEGAQQAAASADEIREALQALSGIAEQVQDVPPREARRVVERLVTKVTVMFDHSRPSNRNQASHVELEFHPDVAELVSRKE